MGRRLGLGLIKGLVIGAAIGAGITFGAHGSTPSGGLLAYLLALGTGGTTGIFAGRAPWKDGAWVEAAIKGVVGVCVAALAYWLASTYGAASIPWPGSEHAVPWTSLPMLYLGAIGGVYGALVELDHDDDDAPKKKSPAKTRVADEDADTELGTPAMTARPSRKKS